MLKLIKNLNSMSLSFHIHVSTRNVTKENFNVRHNTSEKKEKCPIKILMVKGKLKLYAMKLITKPLSTIFKTSK